MSENHHGRCNCGAVNFTTKGPLREVVASHCSQCRRQTGLFYAATNVARASVDIRGCENVTWYRASDDASRGFCRVCGSALFWQGDGDHHVSIMAGAFDQPSGLVMGRHIYCADKGDFYQIDDGLPQYPGADA